MFQELTHVTRTVAAAMVGLASIGNAVGRVFWAWISDSITRRATFIVMFAIQVLLFRILPGISSAPVLTVITFLVLMCYGGGFGTMPAFTADYFGLKNVGPIYGLMLTAWGAASAFGPLLIAYVRDISGSYRGALHIIGAIVFFSISLPFIISPPHHRLSRVTNNKQQRTEAA